MLHCLSVIDHTHLRDSHDRDASLCGLKMASQADPLTFANDDAPPTCGRCRARARPESKNSALPVLGPKSIVVAVLEHGLSGDDGRAAATLVTSGRDRFVDAARTLQALFPGWSAQVLTLIAEGNRLFATYRVTCSDPNGLLKAGPGSDQSGQISLVDSAIFQIVRGDGAQPVLGKVEPIRDRFGIWISAGLSRNQEGDDVYVG